MYLLFISCSYIGGSESDGHFSVINEACSMLVTLQSLQLYLMFALIWMF